MKIAKLLLLATIALILFAVALAAPAAAQTHSILVYSGEGQVAIFWAEGRFSWFAWSAGDNTDLEYRHTDIVEGDDFSAYDCVILPGGMNSVTSFSPVTKDVLATYVQGGGLVLALGEDSTSDSSANTTCAMNDLAFALGSGLSIVPAALGPINVQHPVTSNINTSLFTQNVKRIGYWRSSRILVNGGAQSLIRDAGFDGPCILAAEKIGDGWLLLSGDNAIFNDKIPYGDGFVYGPNIFKLYDNDALVQNIVHRDSVWELMAAEEKMVMDVLICYEQGLERGLLEGIGKTPTAARAKAEALGSMLRQVQAHIEDAKWTAALGQLKAALAKCDGLQRPPDFVQGPAQGRLRELIEALIAAVE